MLSIFCEVSKYRARYFGRTFIVPNIFEFCGLKKDDFESYFLERNAKLEEKEEEKASVVGS